MALRISGSEVFQLVMFTRAACNWLIYLHGPDSIGIFAVAQVALGISGSGVSHLGFCIRGVCNLVYISLMAPDSIGIFVVA